MKNRGFSLMFSVGRWAGFLVDCAPRHLRIVVGWVCLGIFAFDADLLMGELLEDELERNPE